MRVVQMDAKEKEILATYIDVDTFAKDYSLSDTQKESVREMVTDYGMSFIDAYDSLLSEQDSVFGGTRCPFPNLRVLNNIKKKARVLLNQQNKSPVSVDDGVFAFNSLDSDKGVTIYENYAESVVFIPLKAVARYFAYSEDDSNTKMVMTDMLPPSVAATKCCCSVNNKYIATLKKNGGIVDGKAFSGKDIKFNKFVFGVVGIPKPEFISDEDVMYDFSKLDFSFCELKLTGGSAVSADFKKMNIMTYYVLLAEEASNNGNEYYRVGLEENSENGKPFFKTPKKGSNKAFDEIISTFSNALREYISYVESYNKASLEEREAKKNAEKEYDSNQNTIIEEGVDVDLDIPDVGDTEAE